MIPAMTRFGTYLQYLFQRRNYRLCHLASNLQLSLPDMAAIVLGDAPAPNVERLAAIMVSLSLDKDESALLTEKAAFSWIENGMDINEQLNPSVSILRKTALSDERHTQRVLDSNGLRLRVKVKTRRADDPSTLHCIYTDTGDQIKIDEVKSIEHANDAHTTHYVCRARQYLIDLFSDPQGWYIDASSLAVS